MTLNEAEAEWHEPRPERVPRPTYCPVTMAVGIILMVWGPLASWVLLAAGGVVFALALICWINELRHDAQSA